MAWKKAVYAVLKAIGMIVLVGGVGMMKLKKKED